MNCSVKQRRRVKSAVSFYEAIKRLQKTAPVKKQWLVLLLNLENEREKDFHLLFEGDFNA